MPEAIVYCAECASWNADVNRGFGARGATPDAAIAGLVEHCEAVGHTWRPGDLGTIFARTDDGAIYVGPPELFDPRRRG